LPHITIVATITSDQ